MTQKFGDISKYIFGTGRLGDENLPFAEQVRMARTTMEAGVWFHTSQVSQSYSILKS